MGQCSWRQSSVSRRPHSTFALPGLTTPAREMGTVAGRHPQQSDFLLNYTVVFCLFHKSQFAAGLQRHKLLWWTTHEIKVL